MKVDNIECDLLIPSLKTAIMVDGNYFHQGKLHQDQKRTERLERLGYRVYRFRGQGLPFMGNCIPYDEARGLTVADLQAFLRLLISDVRELKRNKRIAGYLKLEAFSRDEDFISLVSQIPGPMRGSSLGDLFPEVSEHWHPTKKR